MSKKSFMRPRSAQTSSKPMSQLSDTEVFYVRGSLPKLQNELQFKTGPPLVN